MQSVDRTSRLNVGKGSANDAIRFANELHKLLELEFEALKITKPF